MSLEMITNKFFYSLFHCLFLFGYFLQNNFELPADLVCSTICTIVQNAQFLKHIFARPFSRKKAPFLSPQKVRKFP